LILGRRKFKIFERLENIGEAVKNLSNQYKHENPEIEWGKIA